MAEPLRVLHVLHRLRRAGAEMRVLEVIEAARAEGIVCDIHVDSGREGELDARARELGCRIHAFARGGGYSRRLGSLLRSERYGAVHSHVGYTTGSVLRTAYREGVPVRIAHLHNSRLSRSGLVAEVRAATMRRWIARYATHIVGVSRGVLEQAWRPGWQSDPRCRVVYNGLDVTPFAAEHEPEEARAELGIPAGAPLLLHVGRVHRQKNHEGLLRAFAALLSLEPEARLVLVGDAAGSAGEPVRRLASALGIAGALLLAGVRDDVPRLMLAADALLFPSLWEGLPGVVVEACAAGLPVVASDIPGIPEIAERFPSVRLVRLSAPPEAWAEATRAALREGRPAEPAWRRWEETPFTTRACAEAWISFWREAVRGR